LELAKANGSFERLTDTRTNMGGLLLALLVFQKFNFQEKKQ
jgi:hypothetical protein